MVRCGKLIVVMEPDAEPPHRRGSDGTPWGTPPGAPPWVLWTVWLIQHLGVPVVLLGWFVWRADLALRDLSYQLNGIADELAFILRELRP